MGDLRDQAREELSRSLIAEGLALRDYETKRTAAEQAAAAVDDAERVFRQMHVQVRNAEKAYQTALLEHFDSTFNDAFGQTKENPS